jgi:hypothetical protein
MTTKINVIPAKAGLAAQAASVLKLAQCFALSQRRVSTRHKSLLQARFARTYQLGSGSALSRHSQANDVTLVRNDV